MQELQLKIIKTKHDLFIAEYLTSYKIRNSLEICSVFNKTGQHLVANKSDTRLGSKCTIHKKLINKTDF